MKRRLMPCLVLALGAALAAGSPRGSAAAAPPPSAPAAGPATATAPSRPAGHPGAGLPAGVARGPSIEGITEYRLANGLRVLLFPDASKQTVTVNVTYLVGSRNEDYGETGMAHLLEHLQFKGTPRHRSPSKELTTHGAVSNASTSYDRTNYFETLKASDENLQWALDLEADRMVHSFIAKHDLDSEMTVVRNEYESGENSPFRVTMFRTLAAAYEWHNYGKVTIGARSDIENVPIDRLQAFYRRYYQPDDAILLVAGRFDPAKTLAWIARDFSPIPRPKRALPAVYTEEPTQEGERQVTVRRTGDVQLVMAAYHLPAGADPSFAALSILASVLGDSPSGRLHKALVEPGKASSVFQNVFQLHDPGVVLFGANVRKDSSLDEARDLLLKTVESAGRLPVTKEEVERARASLLKDIEQTLDSADDLGLELSEWMAMGDWRLYFLQRDQLKQVTPEEVQRVAAAYLKSSNRTLGLFIPDGKPDRAAIPPKPDIVAMLKDYKGGEAKAAGEAFEPTPRNVLARTTFEQMPGGLKLALLPKKTRGATVNLQLDLHFGDEASLSNQRAAAAAVPRMLSRGTSKHTRQQLADELDRLKAQVSVRGGTDRAAVSVQTVRENLPAVLALVAEMLREPSFPADELEQLRRETLLQAERSRSQPEALAFMEYGRDLYPYPKGHPFYSATFDEQIEEVKALSLEQVKAFYAGFYGASNGELAVVGDFDAGEVRQLAGRLFGDWKSPHPFTRVTRIYRETASASRTFETPEKANASFVAGQLMPLRDDDPDYPALVLGNEVLGGTFVSSRLGARIREKEGLSYTVGSFLDTSSLDRVTNFMVFAIYAPQNLSRLEAAFHEEMERVVRDGLTAQEIKDAKPGFLQGRLVQRADDGALSSDLAEDCYLGRTPQWDADFEQKISSLTADEVNAVLRRRLDPAKLLIIKAGDFAHAGAKAAAAAPSKP